MFEKGSFVYRKPLPSLHSDHYYPVPEPSINTGVLTMNLAALNLLGKGGMDRGQ